MTFSLRIYGIRHHGPGSAHSLEQALRQNAPDCLLVEGPPDAAEMVPLLAEKQVRFPVALLLYVPDDTKRAVYYPFAEFSPETVAIRFALKNNIPVRFMDLPMAHDLALELADEPQMEETVVLEPEKAIDSEETPTTSPELPEIPFLSPRRDPLLWLAQAAGYEDSERWWEDLVEHRRDGSGIFEAILEAMTALRVEMDAAAPLEGDKAIKEDRREAWMRTTIRAAQKEFQNIAVVCGAWHGPALAETLPEKFTAAGDAKILKGLPKTKIATTLVPWTNDRLSFESGYGAGITSPGWYEHLWSCRQRKAGEIAPRWMARVASLMRGEDLDASAAHLIEAVRLAQTLAALRGRALTGLVELNEATRAVLGFGDEAALNLIERKLIVGQKMGVVPDSAPAIPLQQDLAREQKRLRFPPDAEQKILDLDLRKPNDLERSRLLHRLQLLGVPWGGLERSNSGKGTFHELWRVQWSPELTLNVIQAGIWGNTVLEAATNNAVDHAKSFVDLPPLSALLDAALLADLSGAIDLVMRRVENVAATSTDAAHLMDALPPLARIYRYGDVRGTKVSAVEPILTGIGARLWINLPPACAAQNDEAAREYLPKLGAVAEALSLWNNDEAKAGWHAALRQITERETMPGLLAGRAARLLFDGGVLSDDEIATVLSVSLSGANEPLRVASWIEGFLGQSGLLLLHDDRLWNAVDEWLCGLTEESFTPILPLLRRTWSQFEAPERREMAERVRRPQTFTAAKAAPASSDFSWERAEAVLPVLSKLLGVPLAQ